MSRQIPASPLLEFYVGAAPDAAGRLIDEIWSWDHRRLEMVHDFIQWLFPLPDPSRSNPDAPLLSGADRTTFRADAGLQQCVRRSPDLMLEFLGLRRDGAAVIRGPHFTRDADHWL